MLIQEKRYNIYLWFNLVFSKAIINNQFAEHFFKFDLKIKNPASAKKPIPGFNCVLQIL
jgi:hypothetical protein